MGETGTWGGGGSRMRKAEGEDGEGEDQGQGERRGDGATGVPGGGKGGMLTLVQLAVLLQEGEPVLAGGDGLPLPAGDVLLAGGFELLQVLGGDVLRQLLQQAAILGHG